MLTHIFSHSWMQLGGVQCGPHSRIRDPDLEPIALSQNDQVAEGETVKTRIVIWRMVMGRTWNSQRVNKATLTMMTMGV